MSKLMSLDKQLEELSKKWFIKAQTQENRALAKKFFEENKKEIMDEYLQKHPKVNEEYKTKKSRINKIKIRLCVIGAAVTLVGVGAYTYKTSNQPEQTGIEQETENIENENEIEEKAETVEENPYQEFFEEARDIENTNRRNEFITNQTKQIIVEAYNKEHPENPITVDRLETLILNENVLRKEDRLGNYTYERVKQNVRYEQNETQRLVKIGNMYDFRIDGQTVAVFDKNGSPLQDKNAKSQDMSFARMIKLLDVSQELKDVYKYLSNDYEKEKIENEYKQVADQVLEETNRNIEEQERE